jgi:hypothetical protein
MLIAISIAHALLVVLILLVESIAALASAPTWSTGGRSDKNFFNDPSLPSIIMRVL